MIANVLGAAARVAALMLVVACAGGAPPPASAGTTGPHESGTPAFETGGSTVALSTAPSAPAELAATRVDASRVPKPSLDAPSRGPTHAPVTIQVFSDFECPYCAVAAPVVRELEAEFGSSVRVVWRNLPLQMHAHAALAAETALEVYAQRGGAAFWRFHDSAFAAQRSGIDENVILNLAEACGADKNRLRTALSSHTHAPKIEADLAAADAAGINGTPAFFVNDWYAVGALPYAEMRAIVVQALKDAGVGL